MKITICGSMVFAQEMVQTKETLEQAGHTIFISKTTSEYTGTTSEKEQKAIEIKNTTDAIKDHYNFIKKSDAILVLNYTKRNIENYIGGNTFLEIGFAHVLNKKIYLLNPIPEIPVYKSEIEAMKPIILHNNLDQIPNE